MKRFDLFLVLLISLSLFACSTEQKNTEKKLKPKDHALLLVEAAKGSLLEGDITGALQILKEAETIDPQSAAVFHMRAVSLLSRKDYNEALAQAKRAHQLEPKNVDIQNTYGRIAMEVNQYDLARKMLSAPAKDNTYREAYKSLTSLGIINYRENKLSAAQADFNRAIQLEPVNSCIAYYYLGNIYQKQKDFETAIRKFKLASESLCAGFSDAHLALAYAYEKAGETGKAKKKYLEVKGLFPNSSASQTAIDKLSKLP